MAEEGTRPKSNLAATQRYAAGALLAIALHQAQIHQTQPLGSPDEDEPSSHDRISSGSSSTDSISDDPELWVHENSALLRPIFRFLEIDSAAWPGLEETAGSSPAKHHIGAFMRLLAEEGGDQSSEKVDQEIALSKAVDAMVQEMETNAESSKAKKEKHQEYEHECREKLTSAESESDSKSGSGLTEPLLEQQEEHEALRRFPAGEGLVETREGGPQAIDTLTENEVLGKLSMKDIPKMSEAAETQIQAMTKIDASTIILRPNDDFQEHDRSLIETPAEEVALLSYQKKVTVLFELLSACLAVANTRQDNKKYTRKRNGYDARHRAALRLLATWFDIKWIEMEAIESIVACSAMAVKKQEELKNEEASSSESKWAKWKRGGIIGAAALTGGTLMAITGGLAAPAIAAGFSALAPTLGTLIPVIGASGFAAAATAAGSVAGSVAVAASFGAAGAGLTGSKMARRTGSVDEFEFKAIGDSHKQGRLAVEIMVSGFVFDEQDFRKPWEGKNDNMERYVLQWESKNLIAVSTAIQDWLTSRIALEFMRQGAMMTVLSSLLVALAWPATLLAAADLIDSRWTIAVDRSDKAGKLLAEVLVKGLQGNRPVTLIGYSLGARVVFKCLQALAETEQSAELVERVVLLGAPISIKGENWEAARKMVAGRFVNAYSANDWMLGVAFRASLLTQGLAGIQPINVPGIENVDVTDFIEGHSSYLWATQPILEQLELEAYYPVFKKKDSEKGK